VKTDEGEWWKLNGRGDRSKERGTQWKERVYKGANVTGMCMKLGGRPKTLRGLGEVLSAPCP
jgi:hypothetical protein